MMADLYALAMAQPTLASVLFLIVLLVVVLLIAVAIGLRRLPWHRAGGNWWPVP